MTPQELMDQIKDTPEYKQGKEMFDSVSKDAATELLPDEFQGVPENIRQKMIEYGEKLFFAGASITILMMMASGRPKSNGPEMPVIFQKNKKMAEA